MYNVAFVNTRAAGEFEGVVTWSSFDSKEVFDDWYTDAIKVKLRVVEQGVTDERCVELVRQTPQACLISAAIEKSRHSVTGVINEDVLKMELQNALMAAASR